MPDSPLAHQLLDGLHGIEIGGSAHNGFSLINCINVDFSDDMNTIFKKDERKIVGFALPVDVVARGDALPFPNESLDYVLTSHVLEHFWDPMNAIGEWLRVVRPGGYLYMIVPHKERTFDAQKPRTTLAELIARHAGQTDFRPTPAHESDGSHWSIWITEDVVELCRYLGLEVIAVQDVDDKVGNGFAVVVKKPGVLAPSALNAAAPKSIPPLDLGCGPNKRSRYIGVDRVALPGVDVVCDVAAGPLPFPDDSVVGIYSNFLFHELENPLPVLREIVRVAKHGADVEIWVPHGRSDLSLPPLARSFFTDQTWAQLIAFLNAPNAKLVWEQAWYVIPEQTQAALGTQKISLDFAVNYCVNVVREYGVLLRVDKRGSYANTVTARSAATGRTYPEAG